MSVDEIRGFQGDTLSIHGVTVPRPAPRAMVLDHVRVARTGEVTISALVRVGTSLGHSSNAIRVSVSRLAARGLLESVGGGRYRLGPKARALGAFVEGWREAEPRRSWDGAWLGCWVPRGGRRRGDPLLAALRRGGFREGLTGLWVRPDNLSGPATRRLAGIGLADAALLRVEPKDPALDARWRGLWDARTLVEGYRAMLAALEASLAALPRAPTETALKETYCLGGAVIRMLATDPELPDALVDGALRRALRERMRVYDEAGRRVWAAVVDEEATPGAHAPEAMA